MRKAGDGIIIISRITPKNKEESTHEARKQTHQPDLSMILAIVMVMSMLPATAWAAEDTTLYLVPNSNWTQANARFAMYCYGNGETWVDMSDLDNDGTYEGTVPAGYSNVIFCRMNPSTTAGNVEYLSCSDCGKTFSDEDGTIEITETNTAALGHNYVDGKCTKCGEADPDAVKMNGSIRMRSAAFCCLLPQNWQQPGILHGHTRPLSWSTTHLRTDMLARVKALMPVIWTRASLRWAT